MLIFTHCPLPVRFCSLWMVHPLYGLLFVFCLALSQGPPCSPPFDDEKIAFCLDTAREMVAEGRHDEALALYQTLLRALDVFPLDVCYHFAEALHRTAHYRQAEELLVHYTEQSRIPLSQAVALLGEVRSVFSAIGACTLCDPSGYRYETHVLCDGVGQRVIPCASCRGVGRIVCLVCRGQGVQIIPNDLAGMWYIHCTRCAGTGCTLCDKCAGAGVLFSSCTVCRATGRIPTTDRCNHRP